MKLLNIVLSKFAVQYNNYSNLPEKIKKLRQIIDDAVDKENQRLKKIHEQKMIDRQQELEDDHEYQMGLKEDEYACTIAQKESEIDQLNKTIQDLEDQIKKSKTAYKNYYKETTAIKKLAVDMATEVRKIFDTSGEFYKHFMAIQDAADSHFKKLQDDDDSNRNLLGLSRSGSNRNKETVIEDASSDIEDDVDNTSDKNKVRRSKNS